MGKWGWNAEEGRKGRVEDIEEAVRGLQIDVAGLNRKIGGIPAPYLQFISYGQPTPIVGTVNPSELPIRDLIDLVLAHLDLEIVKVKPEKTPGINGRMLRKKAKKGGK